MKALVRFFVVLSLSYVLLPSCVESQSKIAAEATIVEGGQVEVSLPRGIEPLYIAGHASLAGAVAVHDVGDGCVLLQMMSGEDCFTWLDLSTGATFGLLNRGRGPDELIDAGYSGFRINGDGEKEIVAYSLSSSEAVIVNLTRSLSTGKTVVISRQKLPKGTMYALASGTRIYCYTMSPDRTIRWCLADEAEGGEPMLPFGKDGKVEDTSKFFAATAISEDGNALVMAMASFPRLYIFKRNGRNISLSLDDRTDDQLLAQMSSKQEDEADCCLWVQVRHGFIYCLIVDSEAAKAGKYEERLLVFDMNGRIKSATAIRNPLTSFVVSESDGAIVGITMDGQLVRFTL